MKLLFHAYIFIDFLWLLFLADRIWPLMRLSIFFDLFWNVQRFFLLKLNNLVIEVLRSYAGVFRGARLSSLTTNACSTENNIPFPNLANHFVLSKFWKLEREKKGTPATRAASFAFRPFFSIIPAVTSTTNQNEAHAFLHDWLHVGMYRQRPFRSSRAWETLRNRMSAPRPPQKFVKVGRKPNVNVKK